MTGISADNATMEPFIGKMKTEPLKYIEIKSLIQLNREVRIYCWYYNAERLYSRHEY